MSTTSNTGTQVIKAGIIGGAGYAGGEMLRILLNHPNVELGFVHSKSNAGKPLFAVHEDLFGETDRIFDAKWSYDVDVLFLCLGHGEAKKFIEANSPVTGRVKIIDLSQDYRLGRPPLDGQPVIYGLPELNRDAIRTARHIANPGCFATALQLGLLPLAKAGLLNDVYTTGITGSTGAGQSLNATSHFSWRANNIQAYKTLTHQHLKEVAQTLQQAGAASPIINFVPWRGDFTRGIFVSSQLRVDRRLEEITALYDAFYKSHPFTILSQHAISLKQVVNTNKCLIQLEQQGSQLVVHSAIDNLLKGASGQAVQNMNLLFGLDEQTGLHLKANAF
ncbi:MAG: N-acetyl-gamma-glutamyl-phosphate reductase [Sphingobacteriales bacterium 50-39]|nr:N-acetyl-gamma-glutamyl-phosphate reductase [Sphingobacteriales bacterium]OJW54862.1 MAG: N-acetyl-gamma-glutamyl-phosphate reductase [Sphingobacteriales bacterium 50-39]